MLSFIQYPAVFQFSNLIKTGSITKKNQVSIKWECCLFIFLRKSKRKIRCLKQRSNSSLIRIQSHELNRCFELLHLLKHNPLHEAHWIFKLILQYWKKICIWPNKNSKSWKCDDSIASWEIPSSSISLGSTRQF